MGRFQSRTRHKLCLYVPNRLLAVVDQLRKEHRKIGELFLTWVEQNMIEFTCDFCGKQMGHKGGKVEDKNFPPLKPLDICPDCLARLHKMADGKVMAE